MSGHATEATGAAAARRATLARATKPNGWWGMAVFVATEATLFGVFIAAYFYLRFRAVDWPPPAASDPQPLVPSILTAVLIATSIPMQAAASAALHGRLGLTRLSLGAALFVGSGYLAMQAYRFAGQVQEDPPSRDAYDSIVHTLSGGHHVHVLVALLLNLWLLARLGKGLTEYRAVAVQTTALYWHFVNALAVAVLLTVQSPTLA
jgi:heme/copper-type cytochrome/quinol oxidase subunit 3